jgi:hypothetical protein
MTTGSERLPEMGAAQEVYRETLGLLGPGKGIARETALSRAHQIRQFEIELYWKRANYFWLLQAAVFAAVGLTWRADSSLPPFLPVALSSLGILTALGGWLATLGSRFWQRNWEHHIDMLEGEFEGQLYKTVYVEKDGVRWSLSGISEGLAFWFMVFWCFLFFAAASHANPNWNLNPHDLAKPNYIEAITIGLGATTAFAVLRLRRRRGRIGGDPVPYPSDFIPAEPYSRQQGEGDNDVPRLLLRREPKVQ